MSLSYEVVYFAIHGRAEPIRLLLTLAGQTFEDHAVTRDTWPSLKEQMPLGQMPVLIERDGAHERRIPQSQAILRYLARRYGLYGKSEDEMVQADVVADTVVDLNGTLSPLLFGKDRGNPEALAKHFAEVWPVYARRLERLLDHNPHKGGVFFASSLPTFADVAAYQGLHAHVTLSPGCLDGHPRLRAFHDAMEALPAWQDYLARRRAHEAVALLQRAG